MYAQYSLFFNFMWLSIFLELLVQDTAKVMQNAEKYFFFLCIYCTSIGTHEAVQSTKEW